MELDFRKASLGDCEIVFTALRELQDKPLFTLNKFEFYWDALLSGEFGKCDVWLAINKGKVCAYILANYYPIPRYLGEGVELEEVVTLPEHQRKGIGRKFIQFLIAHYNNNNTCRKITVKTDDHSGSGKLYAELFGLTEMRFYHQFLNKI
jgi:GNAT superfamily N-acetyltransferase